MGCPAYLTRAVERAREVRSRYFRKAEPFQYRLADFLRNIMVDEHIRFIEYEFDTRELCGFYRVFEFGAVVCVNANMWKTRRLFTAAHELGHHFLHRNGRHEFTDQPSTLSQGTSFSRAESEANAFAAELLVPFETLVRMLDNRFPFRKVANMTGASPECVKWRVVTLLQDEFDVAKDVAIRLAEDYRDCSERGKLDQVMIYRYIEENRMVSLATQPSVVRVERITIDIVAVCTNGSPYMRPEVVIAHAEVIYVTATERIELDENLRFTQCPRCGNTDFSEDASHCKMCGLHLFNRCSNEDDRNWADECGKINAADAHYCEFCGAETYLTQSGLLKKWTDPDREVASTGVKWEDDPFAADTAVIDISDDDLPF